MLTTLLGDLIGVPWRRAHAVPSATAASTWRAAIGAEPLRQLQRLVLAAAVTEHRDSEHSKSLVITSKRAPADWYPLFPNAVVAESLLDRLINTSHQILMDGPSYRPRQDS